MHHSYASYYFILCVIECANLYFVLVVYRNYNNHCCRMQYKMKLCKLFLWCFMIHRIVVSLRNIHLMRVVGIRKTCSPHHIKYCT